MGETKGSSEPVQNRGVWVEGRSFISLCLATRRVCGSQDSSEGTLTVRSQSQSLRVPDSSPRPTHPHPVSVQVAVAIRGNPTELFQKRLSTGGNPTGGHSIFATAMWPLKRRNRGRRKRIGALSQQQAPSTGIINNTSKSTIVRLPSCGTLCTAASGCSALVK